MSDTQSIASKYAQPCSDQLAALTHANMTCLLLHAAVPSDAEARKGALSDEATMHSSAGQDDKLHGNASAQQVAQGSSSHSASPATAVRSPSATSSPKRRLSSQQRAVAMAHHTIACQYTLKDRFLMTEHARLIFTMQHWRTYTAALLDSG